MYVVVVDGYDHYLFLKEIDGSSRVMGPSSDFGVLELGNFS